jgi:penicillin-binding protein 2
VLVIAANLKEHLRDHALFTGFAPIENPKIAIAVIVENAGSGSSKAAPLAKAVLDLYFICPKLNKYRGKWSRSSVGG